MSKNSQGGSSYLGINQARELVSNLDVHVTQGGLCYRVLGRRGQGGHFWELIRMNVCEGSIYAYTVFSAWSDSQCSGMYMYMPFEWWHVIPLCCEVSQLFMLMWGHQNIRKPQKHCLVKYTASVACMLSSKHVYISTGRKWVPNSEIYLTARYIFITQWSHTNQRNTEYVLVQ